MHYNEQSRSDSSYAGRRGRVPGDEGRATRLRFQLACQLAEPLRFHRDQTDFVHFRSRTFFSAARIFKRNAFNRINPVASLWSYAGASPSIIAIFGSYRLFGLLRPATIL